MYYLTKNGNLIESSEIKYDLELVAEPSSEIFDSWPPVGRKFENGSWIQKTNSEKTIDGEISLPERIEALKLDIQAYLDQKLEEGVGFGISIYQSREKDLLRMNNVLKKIDLGGTWSGFWRDRSNNWQSLTAEELGRLAVTAGNYWESCFRKASRMIDELTSKNKTELANYDIESFWNSLSP